MEEVKEFIIAIEEKGMPKTITRKETLKELKERIKCYKKNNIEVISIFEKVITITYNKIEL